MRAAVMTGHGGPDRLVLTEVSRPTPDPGQVLVRVAATSVNNTDIWTREGAYGTASDPDAIAGWLGAPIDCPRIQGADVVGVIADVDEDGDRALVGRRVLIDPAEYGPDGDIVGVLGSEFDGGFAEFVVVDRQRCHDVTASPLSNIQLAALPIAYGTALGMLRRASISPGDTLVVTGASGGVGVGLVQLGRALGARVIAVSTTDRTDTLLELGADHVVDRTDPEVVTHARHAAGDSGIDAVADVVGGEAFGGWVDALRTGGRLVVAGAIAGPVVPLDLRRVYLGQRTIVGSTMHDEATFVQLVDIAVCGDIDPPIAEVFTLDEIHAAQAAIRSSAAVGKVVIDLQTT